MIIKRIAQAIKRQDLSQVIVEILIVVIGIFLGLQVTNWAEDQALRGQEQIYLNQLHDEVISALIVAEGRYEGSASINERLFELTNHFAGKIMLSEFTSEHCQAIANSHLLRNIVITLPTITEIISSGQLVIIHDQKLKSVIASYSLDTERNAGTREATFAGIRRLGPDFPDLITLAPLAEIEIMSGEGRFHQCEFEAMKDDKAFINELISNSTRQNAVTRQFPQQIELLNELHSELDRLLGVSHARENP